MTGTITADRARQEHAEYEREMNRTQMIPKLSRSTLKTQRDEQVYLYNVGPFSKTRELGSIGKYTVPACEEGKEYSAPLIIPGIVVEYYRSETVLMTELRYDGIEVAEAVLGIGPMTTPGAAFEKFGIFISDTEVPSKEALRKAKAHLNAYFHELITQMASAMAVGPKEVQEKKTQAHIIAAQRLKKTAAECPWMSDSIAQSDRSNCPSCDTVYRVGIIKCKDCGFILDKKKFEENKSNYA